MISIIVALAKNNVIGSKNKIPWLLKADLVKLKRLTLGQVVIVGRKTYESMAWYYNQSGRDMPANTYIAVTTDQYYKPEKDKTLVAHSVDQAIKKAKELTRSEVFVIGGAKLYEAMLPLADKLYVTEVDARIEGDTYFPNLPSKQWQEVSREAHTKDDKNAYNYTFVTLVRQRPRS